MRPQVGVTACLLVATSVLSGQSISYGVQGGALPNSQPSDTPIQHFENRRYTFGPLIEIGLPKNFAVEFSPLYKRLGFSETFVSQIFFTGSGDPVITTIFWRERVNAWEFPIVGKYYFGATSKRWRPVVLTGYSFTKSWVSFQQSPQTPPSPASGPPEFTLPLGVGAVFGCGIVSRKGPVKFGPEFRYTRNGAGYTNQVEVLFSVRF